MATEIKCVQGALLNIVSFRSSNILATTRKGNVRPLYLMFARSRKWLNFALHVRAMYEYCLGHISESHMA